MRFFFSPALLLWTSIGAAGAFGPGQDARAQVTGGGAATVAELAGEARVVSADGKKKTPLSPNASLEQGSIIETGANSKVLLLLADHSVAALGSRSRLRISAASPDSEKVELQLDRGKVKAAVEKRKSGRFSFTIRTRAASMGVRGTRLVVTASEDSHGQLRSNFFCLSGSIVVSDAAGKELAVLQGGASVSVEGTLGERGEVTLRNVHPLVQPISKPAREELDSDRFLKTPAASAPGLEETGNGGSAGAGGIDPSTPFKSGVLRPVSPAAGAVGAPGSLPLGNALPGGGNPAGGGTAGPGSGLAGGGGTTIGGSTINSGTSNTANSPGAPKGGTPLGGGIIGGALPH